MWPSRIVAVARGDAIESFVARPAENAKSEKQKREAEGGRGDERRDGGRRGDGRGRREGEGGEPVMSNDAKEKFKVVRQFSNKL